MSRRPSIKSVKPNSAKKPPLRHPPADSRSFSFDSIFNSSNDEMWSKQLHQRGLESLQMYSFQLTNDRKAYCGTEASDKLYAKAFSQKGEKFASGAEMSFISRTSDFIAYQNGSVPVGYGSVLIPPSHAAKIFDLASQVLHSKSRVLEIGSGSGYLTAGFSHIIKYPAFQNTQTGKNYLHEMLHQRAKHNSKSINSRSPMIQSFDHSESLIERSKRHFTRIFPHFLSGNFVSFHTLDCRHPNFIPSSAQENVKLRSILKKNWEVLKKNGPYDLIYIGCGLQSTRIPDEFLELLLIGGRCIAECGDTWDDQWLTVADRLSPPKAPEKIPITKYEFTVPGINGAIGMQLHKKTYTESLKKMKDYNLKVTTAKEKFQILTKKLGSLKDQTTKQADALRAKIDAVEYHAGLKLLDHSNLPIIDQQATSHNFKKGPEPLLINPDDLKSVSVKTIYMSPSEPGPLLDFSVKESVDDASKSASSKASRTINQKGDLLPTGTFASQSTEPLPLSSDANLLQTWRGDEMALKMQFAPSESGQRLNEDPRVAPEFFFYPIGSDRQKDLIGQIEHIPITLQQIRASTLDESELTNIDVNISIEKTVSKGIVEIQSQRAGNSDSPKHSRSRSNSLRSTGSVGSSGSTDSIDSANSNDKPKKHYISSSSSRKVHQPRSRGQKSAKTAYVNPMMAGSASSIHHSIPKNNKPKPKTPSTTKPKILSSSSQSRSRIASVRRNSNNMVQNPMFGTSSKNDHGKSSSTSSNPLLSGSDGDSDTGSEASMHDNAMEYAEDSLETIKNFDFMTILEDAENSLASKGKGKPPAKIPVKRVWVDMYRIMPTYVPVMTALENQLSSKVASKYI